MKNNKFMLNTLLAVVVLLAAGTMMVLRLIQPAVILPKVTIPNLVLVSLVALLADHYLAPKATRATQGVAVMTLKTKYKLDRVAAVAETGIVNHARYRVRSVPAAGALLKAEDSDEKQLELL